MRTMIQRLSTHEAADLLLEDNNAAWTHNGALALVEYLEEFEEEQGTPIEFDRVAIRCDYSEHSSAAEAAAMYDFTPEAGDDEETTEAEALKYLRNNTQVIEFDGGVIIQDW